MRSLWEFLLVALVVTLTPGPATALVLRVAARDGRRAGLLTSLANPKLAIFFVALFPQFLSQGSAVLPAAFGMAGVIVSFDVVYFGTLVWLVHRAGTFLKPRVRHWLERTTGGVMIALGLRVAAAAR